MSCGRKIGPFDCCPVVCGDCLELMKQLPDGCVDAVITDPPYGCDHDTNYKRFVGGRTETHAKVHESVFGDDKPFDPAPWLSFPVVVMFGSNHYGNKLPNGSLLVWDKRSLDGKAFFSEAEVAWMNRGSSVSIFQHCWMGFARSSENSEHYHPTQKPVALMSWCLFRAGVEAQDVVLDPYCGSGTTLVAAKKLGCHFLGFEIYPDYCDIARKRIALVEAQPTLFEPKAEQLTLGATE